MRISLLRLLVVSTTAVGLYACGGEAESPSPEPLGWQTSEEVDEVDVPDNPDVTANDDIEEPEPEPDPGPTLNPDGAVDGSPCAADDECRGGACLTGDAWPEGYCTHPTCDPECDDGAACINSNVGNFCAVTCDSDDDCRSGYACGYETGSALKVCVPPVGAADGEPCDRDSDCQGGTCLTDWPGGFCTTVGCDNFEDCSRQGNNNRCLRQRGPDSCVRICQETSECREGYVCEQFGNGEGLCYPDPAVPVDPAVLAGNPFDITCEPATSTSVSFDYDVAADTVAYMVTPFTKDGRQLGPDRITLPGGTGVDMRGANSFQSIPAQIYGSMNPTIVPATAQFAAQLEPGTHTYSLQTNGAEVCHYLLEEDELGDTIDFNIYLVDVPGIDATTAKTDPDMLEVLQQFDDIYGSAGVSIGTIRYFDITGSDADRFGVLRREGDVEALVQLSEKPGPSMDEALSINIFFTRAFALGGAIGISLGLPGPAGLHGSVGSGVAFTSEYLGQTVEPSLGQGESVDGNVFTGQILAHEVGHYLGLFHTSEQNGYSHDPLPDTQECGRIGTNCPDINNLMFPFAGVSHTEVSADQQWVIQVNPLTKVGTSTNPTNTPGGN